MKRFKNAIEAWTPLQVKNIKGWNPEVFFASIGANTPWCFTLRDEGDCVSVAFHEKPISEFKRTLKLANCDVEEVHAPTAWSVVNLITQISREYSLWKKA